MRRASRSAVTAMVAALGLMAFLPVASTAQAQDTTDGPMIHERMTRAETEQQGRTGRSPMMGMGGMSWPGPMQGFGGMGLFGPSLLGSGVVTLPLPVG